MIITEVMFAYIFLILNLNTPEFDLSLNTA